MGIPVIDIFAGPGGLGEGFSTLTDKKKKRRFELSLSIEKDFYSHKTLLLRSFFRQFKPERVSKKYYDFARGELSLEDLFNKRPKEARLASQEAWCAELGKQPAKEVDDRIETALNGNRNWVLVGGPPCQAYSIVGRSRNNGINPDDPRVYLYREYYRILAVHNPPVFVMENVKGLLSARVDKNPIFQQILSDLSHPEEAYRLLNGKVNTGLSCPGYRIFSLVCKPLGLELDGTPIYSGKDYIIKAEDYGVPQTRHRIILLGIRKDLEIFPDVLTKRSQIPISEVISDLPSIRSLLSRTKDSNDKWGKEVSKALEHPFLNEISASHLEYLRKILFDFKVPQYGTGSSFISSNANPEYIPKWYSDKKLDGVCNHEARAHMVSDLYRYLFVSSFSTLYNRSPKLSDFPSSLLPKHKNVAEGISKNKFADRFRVHLWDEPAKTITSHIHKDGHYYIHPDPLQCRSLSVREAARIQTFPDNYIFCGPRTSQYIQVGNAVPPFLAYQIAQIVSGVFEEIESIDNPLKNKEKFELRIIKS